MATSNDLSPDASYELYTYYHYVQAWVTYCERQYGSGQAGINALIKKMKSHNNVNNLHSDMKNNTQLKSDYLRGKYTLLLMQKIPIDTHPELALSANMWLPVQSYYAVNGVGLALLFALRQRGNEVTHLAFRHSFANVLHSYFPAPFCAYCKGGPEKSYFTFTHINTTAEQVKQQNSLSNPEYATGDHYLGKTLATTRTKILENEYEKRRNNKRNAIRKRPMLSQLEKKQIYEKCHNTTVCDLLYRMRVLSNYKNPDMYLAASDVPDAAKHYNNLVYLTNLLIAGLDLLITKKIGESEMAKFKNIIDSV